MRTRLIILLILFPVTLFAQLSSPGSSWVDTTDYPSASPNNLIFIFCSTDGTDRGSVTADSPGGTAPYTFEWSKWDNTSDSFSIPYRTDNGVNSSTVDTLSEGGYKIHITDGLGYDTSLIGWVYIDQPFVNAVLQDYKCPSVTLLGSVAADSYSYEDISTGTPVELINDVTFLWSSNPSSTIPNSDRELNPTTYDPPLVDVTYKLEVVDSFGCRNESSFFYESIHVLADFEIDPEQGEAPLEVIITDKSIRGFNYRWTFGDDTISTDKDPGTHTYYRPGEYDLQLFIESEDYCTDSTSLKVTVEPSSLNIPNVFTPDDNGDNDFFYIESKSLRYLSVQVFSKSGQRVYYFEGKGDALNDWQGWDGRIGGSKASPGVYFYVVRALGWDNEVYEGKGHRGVLYLYR